MNVESDIQLRVVYGPGGKEKQLKVDGEWIPIRELVSAYRNREQGGPEA